MLLFDLYKNQKNVIKNKRSVSYLSHLTQVTGSRDMEANEKTKN